MITENDLSIEQMDRLIAAASKCGECPDPRPLLVKAWGGYYGVNSYVLKCPNNRDHSRVHSVEKKSKDQIESEKNWRRIHILKGTELQTMSDNEMLERVDMARFPQDLKPKERLLVAKIAIEYGLDPLMGELLIIYGALFVPLSARLRKAQETDKFDGINTRPATEEEKKGRKYSDEDDLWVAEVWKIGSSRAFQAFGGVKKKEVDKAIAQAKSNNRDPESLPIVKDPAQHAEKRAIARALRMGFHLPLPSYEDIGSEEVNGAISERDSNIIEVNKDTGEIVSSEVGDKAPAKAKRRNKSKESKPDRPDRWGPGCPNCNSKGYVETADGSIPCPECFGQPGSFSPEGATKDAEEEESKGSNPPETPGQLLEWVASHGKEHNKSWLLTNFSWSDKDLNNRLGECYQEILQITGWDPR